MTAAILSAAPVTTPAPRTALRHLRWHPPRAALLWAAFNDAEIMAIEQRLVASPDPAGQALLLRWMAPALPPAQRAAWLVGARKRMPAAAFARVLVLEGARAALNDTAWAKLARASGVAPVPGLVEV